MAQEPIEERSFIDSARARAEVKACPGREGYEVDAALLQLPESSGYKGDPRRMIEGRVPGDVDLANVLGCDVAIRADVNDVDARDSLVPEMVDDLCYQATRNECLAQPDFIGDKEPMGWLGILIHSSKDMLDGRELKILEAGEDAWR
jgi:hypothetical protein